MKREVEIKFLNIDKDSFRKKLINFGFRLEEKERMMKRKSFHFLKDRADGRRRWARVRDEGHKVTMTVKEVKISNDINGVYESEVVINNFEDGVALLKSLGMTETAYQETLREEWINNDGVYITIDTWPHLKTFTEIEAPSEELVKLFAKKFGFNFEEGLIGGVDVVYKKVHNISSSVICKAPKITFDMSLERILDFEG